VSRTLPFIVLLVPLGCRGTFDISKYQIADGETAETSNASESATTDNESSTTLDETDTEAEAETLETETETSPIDCPDEQLELAGNCFGLIQEFAVPGSPTDLDWADFNNDQRNDLLIAGAIEVSLAFGSPGGLFDSPVLIPNATGIGVTVADFNADGSMDFASIADAAATFHLNNGNGTFIAPIVVVAIGGVDGVFADVNGDTAPDLVVSGGQLRVFVNDGNWTMTNNLGYDGRGLALGNLDGDEDLDIVLAQRASSMVATLENDGTGMFATPKQTVVPLANDVALADITNDGNPDVIAIDGIANVQLFEVGAMLSLTQLASFSVGDMPQSVAVGDLDGDGLTDVVTANSASHDVSILLGDGNTLGEELRMPIQSPMDAPQSILLADINNDEHMEMLVAMVGSNRVVVFGQIP
jgi:hypothetical protein